ncbi:large subunit ribosomal protein L21 [Pricia antarctica]|uniref:Large ribosomal subunit protein bL21 n=1 Tax=Pricia antarctica TaxID=641691 RepID=A0A1G6W7P8_9FLAO|nr:50S ribosomal protein L21 [Pricia antarctica]SDD61851.1 large subunit ribosomal protein L21 [Pricia antarctica]
MYAIVEMAGQQFKVAKDQKVYVHRLQTEEGKKVTFGNVLLLGDGTDITIGAPAIDGASVEAKVIRHLKGDKVIVFKKKRRKGYQKKNGHRQSLTEIVIESIVTKGAKKAEKKEEAKPVAKKDAKEKSAPAENAAAPKAKAEKATPQKEASTKSETKAKPDKDEVSENLISRAEHRAEDSHIEIDVDKLLHSIGTSTKADADDLKEINGIGPAYEERLNEVGVYTYEQISKLKAADRDELSALDGITREKIESEEWVKQARELLKKK